MHRAAARIALFISGEIEYKIWNGNVPIWNGTFRTEGRTADWLLVAVRALVLVSENRGAAIDMNSATSETWSARVPW